MKKILCISGSTRKQSTCMSILATVAERHKSKADFVLYDKLPLLPHFDPDAEDTILPQIIADFRTEIATADGVIFSTPEYVFSVPAILKNAIEWCVASTVFTDKPTAMIVASGVGEKTYESLGLILKTIQAKTFPETMLLLKGIRAKMLVENKLTDPASLERLDCMASALLKET